MAYAEPAARRDRMYAAGGAEQMAQFKVRLSRLADAIDRRERSGILPLGPAKFMRQDLDRVSSELRGIVGDNGRLRPQQQASCAAMLARVERRLLEADMRHRTIPTPLRINRRRAAPVFPAAS